MTEAVAPVRGVPGLPHPRGVRELPALPTWHARQTYRKSTVTAHRRSDRTERPGGRATAPRGILPWSFNDEATRHESVVPRRGPQALAAEAVPVAGRPDGAEVRLADRPRPVHGRVPPEQLQAQGRDRHADVAIPQGGALPPDVRADGHRRPRLRVRRHRDPPEGRGGPARPEQPGRLLRPGRPAVPRRDEA